MNTLSPPRSNAVSPSAPRTRTGVIAFLGNYPPRQCGIATFTHDLCEHYAQAFPATAPFALTMTDHGRRYDYPARVALEIRADCEEDYDQAAAYLNRVNPTVLSLQHEYGIYGGSDGAYLARLLNRAEVPVVTTMHTILQNPSSSQREITELILSASAQIVVMADKARQLLRENYPVDDTRVHVIPHGIPDASFLSTGPNKAKLGLAGRTVILTFGLIGPGKGLEHGIRAMRSVANRCPDALYLILGTTHPHVMRSEGERYRQSLERLVEELKLAGHVRFIDKYATLQELTDHLGAADLYLTPYQCETQITSGTLAYASGCGCPVVSTPYWHARELITPDRGALVPFNDAPAIADALTELIEAPDRRQAMREASVRAGRSTLWPEVVKQYAAVFAKAATRHSAPAPFHVVARNDDEGLPAHLQRFDHLNHMTDEVGIWQHARYREPDPRHGYCLDDNARALLLTAYLAKLGWDRQLPRRDLSSVYLQFMLEGYNPALGRFRNFMDADQRWLEQSGSDDSNGRAVWVLGEVLRLDPFPALRPQLDKLYHRSLEMIESLHAPRAWAFALLGLDHYYDRFPSHRETRSLHHILRDRLAQAFRATANSRWPAPEETLTYGNAKLPHALLVASHRARDAVSVELALQSLDWLMRIQSDQRGVFRPVGNRGWYSRSAPGPPPRFDQQPIEAHASISACLAARRITGEDRWLRLAERTFQWFLGANDLRLPLYDATNGGCRDGLQPGGPNQNQGAESLLAYHLSLAELELAGRKLAARSAPAPNEAFRPASSRPETVAAQRNQA